jgi:hypothetical protein
VSAPDMDDTTDRPLDADTDGTGLIIGAVVGVSILVGIMLVVGHRDVPEAGLCGEIADLGSTPTP